MNLIPIEEVYGQSILWSALQRDISSGRVAHAFLLSGVAGSGKKTAANAIAAAVLCQSGKGTPCGECSACRMLKADTHPDYIHVDLRDKKTIGIDIVRELLEQTREHPRQGGKRVVVFNNLHKTTPQAQNALLKSLEEPSEDTLFILLTEQLETVLPTIRSRCQIIRMGRLPKDVFLAAMEARGVLRTDAEALYPQSDGILGRALLIREQPDYAQMLRRASQTLATIKNADAQAHASAELAKLPPEQQQAFLNALETCLLEALHSAAGLGASSAITPNRDFTPSQLHSMMEQVLLTRKRLGLNMQWEIAIEPLLRAMYGG